MVLLLIGLFHPLDADADRRPRAHRGPDFAGDGPDFLGARAGRLARTTRARIMWIPAHLRRCFDSVVGACCRSTIRSTGCQPRFSHVVLEQDMGAWPRQLHRPRTARTMRVRPPGLFDTPGSVAGPAAYAALLGPRLRHQPRSRVEAAALARIRRCRAGRDLFEPGAHLLWGGDARGMMLAYTLTLARQRKFSRATQFAILAGSIFVGGFILAVALGGQAISERFMTLFASDPLSVYRAARGQHLDLWRSRRPARGSPLRRWRRTLGHGGQLLRHLHRAEPSHLGGNPADRLDDRRRRPDDRAVRRRARW